MTKANIGLLKGIIKTTPRGFGFIIIDGEEIFIPLPAMKGAMDGDLVEIEIVSRASPKGPEGRVVKILNHSKPHLTAIVMGKNELFFPLIGPSRRGLLESKKQYKNGDILIVSWEDKKNILMCKPISFIGSVFDPSSDTLLAINTYGLKEEFPKAVLKEASQVKNKKSDKNREDLTHLECVTIDPDTAKDFDDAISLTKDDKGYHLGVHIADVAHFVEPNTALDREAYLRCNSTYFPEKCIPMLPEDISNDLCSLKPNQKRLTVTVLLDFDFKGDLLNYRILRSTIKSRKRFTYKEVSKILFSHEKSPFSDLIFRMKELCLLLKEKKAVRGIVDLALPDVRFKVNKKGDPISLEVEEYDLSHQMIEEFMLKANEIVAFHLTQMPKKLIFRVHEEPAFEDMEEFYNFAKGLGFYLPPHPSQKDVAKLFLEAKNSAYLKHLSLHYIKSMKLAIYSGQNIGHFGLALAHYCHFTSPIRRYVDLVAERLLFDEEPFDINIDTISKDSSERERRSAQAENLTFLYKKLRYLKKFTKNQIFDATITKIKPYFIFFEIPELLIDGSLHLSSFKKDYLIYDEQRKELNGKYSGKIYRFGSKLKLRLKNLDLTQAIIEWMPLE